MVKIAHTMSFTNKPKKTSKLFFTVRIQRLPESCQLHLQNWRSNFLVATAVTLSIAFLAPIGDTCKSHVNVHGHSDKLYHQLMATQVKLPRKSLATEQLTALCKIHTRNQGPKNLGPTLSIFGLLLVPSY